VPAIAPTVPAMMAALPAARITGKDVGSQQLVHNVALFARYPHPESVTSAFVGTSRSKVLRPEWFGLKGAVNGSGNGYNDISYGILLQLEALRLQFPNLKTVYVESSYLLRRPAGLRIDEEQRPYLPLLESLLPLQQGLPTGGDDFRQRLADVRRSVAPKPTHRMALLELRGHLRLSKLLPGSGDDAGIPVLKDKWLAALAPNGEIAALPGRDRRPDEQRPEVRADHIKVQRLRPIAGWYPWDGLFDMVARWGDQHGILTVFFEPPVRSDVYRFQRELGIERHVQDMQRVARQYGKPYIDLNVPELGYQDDWSTFSDEDHINTCRGVLFLHGGIAEGLHRFRSSGELLPRVSRSEVEAKYANQLKMCAAGA
jgi:hypothetical protein